MRFLILALVASFAVSTPVFSQVRTLEEALTAASQNGAVAREFEARVAKAEAQQFRADYAWTPKVQSTFIFSVVPGEAELDQFANNLDQYLDFNFGPYLRNDTRVLIPLYTFGKLSNAQDLASLGVDVAHLQREAARRDMEFQVSRAFYTVQLARSFQTLLDEGTELIKPKLAEMEEDRDFGEATFDTEDFRKLQIFDAEFDTRVLDNRKLDSIARAGLGYLTGWKGMVEVTELPTPTPIGLLSVDQAHELAMKHRPDLKMLLRGVRARELTRQKAINDYYPNVFAVARFGFGVSTESIALKEVCRKPTPDSECIDTTDLYARPYSNPLSFLSFDVALGLEWTFDFVQLLGKHREADAELEEMMAKQDRALGAIQLEVEKLWTEAALAREKVLVQEKRLDAARRWRDQFGLSVQTAGADISKGIDPLKAYFEARVALLQSHYEYQVARAALAKGLGLNEVPVDIE